MIRHILKFGLQFFDFFLKALGFGRMLLLLRIHLLLQLLVLAE